VLNRTTEAHAALEQAYQMLSEILSGLPPEMQKMSWQQVPEHSALLAAWQAIQPPLATIRLPRVDVPTGRPLRDDEWVEITWTSAEAGDEEIGSKLARRQHRLLRLLRQAKAQGAVPTVEDLAMVLGTSVTTIKRDLATLRRSGQSVHTRGNRADKSW
jgi:biotin operon repressor